MILVKKPSAGAEIQAFKDKEEAVPDTRSRMRLAVHDKFSARSIGEFTQEIQSDNDWPEVSCLESESPGSPHFAACLSLGSPTQFQGLSKKPDLFHSKESTDHDVHPLARPHIVPRICIMPVDSVPHYKEQAGSTKLLVQDQLTVRQVHRIHTEVMADAIREAQRFADSLELDEMSFGG